MITVPFKRVADRLILDTDVMSIIRKRDVYLAGGALRGIFGKDETIMDYDVFFPNGLVSHEVGLDLEDIGFEVIFKCPEGKLTSYKRGDLKVQLITENFYPSPENLIDTFDINACRIAFWADMIYTDRNAIRDMRRKRITLHKVDFPMATFKRIVKYTKKNYVLDNRAVQFYVSDIVDKTLKGIPVDGRFYID